MTMLTRRERHRLLATGLLAGAAGRVARARGGPAEAGGESRIRGVLIGMQSCSFRDRDLQPAEAGIRNPFR